jgi:CheY-like chemotaxis protein
MIGSHAQPNDTSHRITVLGVLAGAVAHEINNPLAYAMGNLSFAIEHLQSAGASTPDLAMILSSLRDALEGAERVRRTVRVLKMFSRPAVPTKGPMDLGRVVLAAVAMAKLWHGSRVTTDIDPLPSAIGNENAVAQALLAILLQATSLAEARRASDGEVHVMARASDDEVTIEIGIPGTDAPAAFDLEWCRRIAEDQGGTLAVQQVDGNVAVRMVLAVAKEAQPPSGTPESPRQPRRAKLLVVDDEPRMGSAISRILGPLHEVTAVYGAEDALTRLLEGEEYDVILCDLMMPRMTGAELYRALEAKAPRLARRMIFMTGGPLAGATSDLLGAIDNLRIEKPFSPGALREAIERTVARAVEPSEP